MHMNAETVVREILEPIGVTVDGGKPCDIRVHDRRFYTRALLGGSLGLGESYMDGWWDCDRLDEYFTRILRHGAETKVKRRWSAAIAALVSNAFNRQSRRRAYANGQAHYDKGNDLYRAMLDQRMVYTCGYWKTARTLDDAQAAKLDLVCRKIGLRPGQTVLDIGCGWGSFAKFAAEQYGAVVTGVTVSEEQVALGRELCRGLPVELRLQDYREVEGRWDHVISLGMFEHVGVRNYRTYMKVAARCLKDDGAFLLHTIGGNRSVTSIDPWMDRYIFPNATLPSVSQITDASEGIFVLEDWHNFGPDYDRTLMAWHANFERRWPTLKDRYDERFRRMWRYYLLSCAGTFRARRNHLWQIVFSKRGFEGGYRSVR